ncbi:hypothetical protein VZ95_20700 [Elstera litoralis]|uniref:Uncharacterized protein n=1 Tax=Elstera litoralis TaxID=552518 RepID=A0A0F3IIC0_9PROT|nr:hypothetical protein VZ95_20700 [Elstera litoralis]
MNFLIDCLYFSQLFRKCITLIDKNIEGGPRRNAPLNNIGRIVIRFKQGSAQAEGIIIFSQFKEAAGFLKGRLGFPSFLNACCKG